MTTSAAKANRNAEIVDRLEAEIERLTAALRDTPCPRPANTAPDDLTAGQCVDRLECGCNIGAALAPATTGRPT
jgi:hypothetical protein